MKPFFTAEEKRLAKTTSRSVLKSKYEQSEKSLQTACRTGKIANIRRAMAKHHTLEYAMLYQTYDKHRPKIYWTKK